MDISAPGFGIAFSLITAWICDIWMTKWQETRARILDETSFDDEEAKTNSSYSQSSDFEDEMETVRR